MIEAKNVDFYYGDFHALKNISMTMESNTVTAFIGPSGCGKSTFLRLFNRMNDLIPGTRLTGECLVDGNDIYGKGVNVDELRKNVGMVFQKPNPFPKSIFENVAYGLRVNGVRDKAFIRQRVEESLAGAALWDEVKDKLKKSAYELSGGQQKRVGIARALAVSPRYIVFDESISGLDVILRKSILELLKRVQEEEQCCYLFITHEIDAALYLADEIHVMQNGKLIESRQWNGDLKIFQNPYTKQLLRASHLI